MQSCSQCRRNPMICEECNDGFVLQSQNSCVRSDGGDDGDDGLSEAEIIGK